MDRFAWRHEDDTLTGEERLAVDMNYNARQRMAICQLEDRTVTAVFYVATVADSGPGSLRQGIIDANVSPGADSVQFQPEVSGTITLSSALTVTEAVSVVGPGLHKVYISGNYANRVFVSDAGLTLDGLNFTNGGASLAPNPGYGGLILSNAGLTINNCSFGGGRASLQGGAIHHTGGSLTIANSSFIGNGQGSTYTNQGGAVYASGSVVLTGCQFKGNATDRLNAGGSGVFLKSGTLSLDDCTFEGNGNSDVRYGYGGAIMSFGPLTARNCTFANNFSNTGGALYLTTGGTLQNCTVVNNAASSFAPAAGLGGGIVGNVTLESTIVSGNTAYNYPDISGDVTAKNCALGNSSGFTSYTDQGGNLPFGTDLKLNPNGINLNGGPVNSVALLVTSPCKDAGTNPNGLANDTRGPGYPRTFGTAPDIGAFEIQAPPRVTIVINGGAVQNSRVTTMSLTFPRDIDFKSINTWQLKRASDDVVVTLGPGNGGQTTNTITFEQTFSGGPVENGSLADGVYKLTVFSSQLTDSSGQFLDGNGDGIGGDDYVSPTTPGDPNRIFRLFGDVDGDADVDAADFIQFRLSFGGSNLAFDFDGDGAVAASDFIQFRLRFGSMI